MSAEVRVLGDHEFDPTRTALDTELANARRLVALHGHALRYCYPWKCWLEFDGKRFRRDDTGGVYRRATATVRSIYSEAGAADDPGTRAALSRWAAKSETRAQIQNMISLAESEPGIPVTPDQLDADPWLFNVKNGTLDLRTGGLLQPHDPEDLATKLSDIEWDAHARCPLWDAFLEKVLPDPEVRSFLQRYIGYSLTGDVREQFLLLFIGLGSNGKSVLMRLLAALLGDYARQADFEAFLTRDGDGPRNDLAALRGARLVPASEIDAGRRLSEVVVKTLTGGDPITCRHLYGEFFTYTPTFKILLSANHKPIIRGTDLAIWRRIRLVPFEVTIPPAEQDRELATKLLGELPGILAWAVRGCLDWQAHGLTAPPAVIAATAGYRADMDVLGSFLDERCELDPLARTPAGDLYASYCAWCSGVGEHPLAQRNFGLRLGDRGLVVGRSGKARFWKGVRLIGDASDASDAISETFPHEHAREKLPEVPSHPSHPSLLASEARCPACNAIDYEPQLDGSRRCACGEAFHRPAPLGSPTSTQPRLVGIP